MLVWFDAANNMLMSCMLMTGILFFGTTVVAEAEHIARDFNHAARLLSKLQSAYEVRGVLWTGI